ncbi:MAG: ankyrin repeat domain-containing protein [Methylophilaceae bacterium]|nr:ankyrin repeat domain-containing protein [Methylophilaceae bacterium]
MTVRTWMLIAALALPGAAWAYTDDEQMEFSSAIVEGKPAVVKKYLDAGTFKVDEVIFGWTPLLSAASKGQLEVVKLLVERGANLNYRHPVTKMTAVAHATYENNLPLLEFLLQKGADPNIKMKGGVSVLRMAKDMGWTQAAELLVKYGAKDDGCQEEKCF